MPLIPMEPDQMVPKPVNTHITGLYYRELSTHQHLNQFEFQYPRHFDLPILEGIFFPTGLFYYMPILRSVVFQREYN